jgi:putative ABC transport system substrate-binding protein
MPFKQDDDYTRERVAAIRKGLQEAGFIEGKNYSLAVRFGEGDWDSIPSLAKELGALNPRVIVTIASGASITHTLFPAIPIVFTSVAVDPIKAGLAASYARPGGMFTGNVMNAVGGEEVLVQKRISLFKQMVPNLTRLGLIASEPSASAFSERDGLQKVAAEFGFELRHYSYVTPDDLEGAFASGRRDNVSAFYISADPRLAANVSRVMTFVAASGKPSVGPYPIWGGSGLLMSYSTDAMDGIRRAGAYAAKILNGAKPGDLPIEQASKFTFVINLKTAKAFGIVVPPTLLALADEVIE